jgi:hypothetical protein
MRELKFEVPKARHGVTRLSRLILSEVRILVTVHGTLKLENRNWKFGLHAFVRLMNAFNWGPSFSTIALYSVTFDSDKTFSCQREDTDHTLPLYLQRCCRMIVLSDNPWCSEPFCSTYQSRARPYLITLLPVCRHPTPKLVASLPNFYFPISSFKP